MKHPEAADAADAPPQRGRRAGFGPGLREHHIAAFRAALGPVDEARVRFLNAQDAEDETEEGLGLIRGIAEVMRNDARTKQDISKLVIGLNAADRTGFRALRPTRSWARCPTACARRAARRSSRRCPKCSARRPS